MNCDILPFGVTAALWLGLARFPYTLITTSHNDRLATRGAGWPDVSTCIYVPHLNGIAADAERPRG